MRFLALITAILFAAPGWGAQPWSTPEQDAQAQAELKAFFADAKVRFPGMPGNKKIEKKIEKIFVDSGFAHGEIGFRTPVFKPGKTTLTLGVDNYELLPMHPTLMRPGNFDKDDVQSKLVYVGRGSLDDLDAIRGADLKGAIALMEFDNPDWLRLLRFGVKGFVFIEPEVCESGDAVGKVFASDACVPRFLIGTAEGAKLRAAIKGNNAGNAIIVHGEPSVWENDVLHDLWVLVPGQDEELKKEVCIIVAQMDSNCIVPELAEGAQAGANLYMLTRLLKQFQTQPPARTVLLAAVNARTQYFLGDRMLVEHLCAPQSDIENIRDLISSDLKLQSMYQGYYKKLSNLLDSKDDSVDALLVEFRTLSDSSTGKQLSVKAPLISRMQADLNRFKNKEIESRGKDESQANSYARQHQGLGKLLNIFNRLGHAMTLAQFPPTERPALHELLARYVRRLLNEYETVIKLNQDDLEQSLRNDDVRKQVGGRVIRWVLSLEMSWSGNRLGFSSGNHWGNPDWRNAFGAKTVEMAKTLAAKTGHDNIFADTMTRADFPEGYYFGASQVLACYQNCAPDQLKSSVPAFALQDVFTGAGRLFTPSDSFERIDPHGLGRAVEFCGEFIPALVAADASMLKLPYVRRATWSTVVRSKAYDTFSSSVLPEVPIEKAFTILRTRNVGVPILGDVSVNYMALTDIRATAPFYGIKDWAETSYTYSYRMDSDYRNVLQTIDMGDRESNISSNLTYNREQTCVMFDCTEFPICSLEDASAVSTDVISVGTWIPLDARREARPQEFAVTGANCPSTSKKLFPQGGPASIFMAPGRHLKLLTGRVIALNSTAEDPEGDGFANVQEFGPDYFYDAVRDMAILNSARLKRLHGVKVNLAEDFLRRGEEAKKAADEKKAAGDYPGYVQSLNTALGAERNAYEQILGITRDMLYGVVFYMALILPFCFFMQKLLFNFVKIEAQIAGFFGLFVVSYVVFRQIHPAFAVAKAPEGILVAFVMGVLALFVVKILHGRFEGEMMLLFQSFTGASAEVGFSTVGQKAMLIGVNNMRRRQVRTMLTTGTIVLVTFTMLAFTSISQTMFPTMIPVTKAPPAYNGIMYHWPGRTMDDSTMLVLKELFHGKGDVIVRRWLLQPHYDKRTYPAHIETLTGESLDINAGLGLSVLEDKFLTEMPLTAGRWFKADDAKEIVLPASTATALKIDPKALDGVKIVFRDTQLAVVGIIDDEKLRLIKDIDQQEILPQKGDLAALAPGVDPAAADLSIEEAGAGASGNAGARSMDTVETVLLPVQTAARFGARVYSVSVRLDGEHSELWPIISNLLTATQAKFYVASRNGFKIEEKKTAEQPNASSESQSMDAGVYYVGSNFKTSFGNLSSLIIPLLISGTIILNTMLGSVFERKKEIAIYNAVGLNPNHIGMFFLSEALVYGIIGSVGGYLIGQLLGILLVRGGVDVDLNFASMKVVFVILFTIAMVLLSTLYPALVATRAAVPSGKRKWSFPPHDGHTMKLVFPFIYHPNVACGVMGYLEEYFGRFNEASVGDLIASSPKKHKSKDEKGRDIYSIEYDIALAPFDLGVTQHVTFAAVYDERVQSYGISMTILRISGQDTNWVTTNKPFLERLRAYLMHWRSLNAGEQSVYAQNMRDALAETPA